MPTKSEARNLFVLISVAQELFLEDPAGFTAKVAQKLRQSSRQIFNNTATLITPILAKIKQSPLDILVDQGEFSQAIEWARKQPKLTKRERTLVRSVQEKLQRLNHQYTPGVPVDGAEVVVHYLTNSLPYTNSGYTLRSQKAIQFQRAAGIKAVAITRLGYPLVIGSLPRKNEETIDGVTYRRMIPNSFPPSLFDRDAEAIKQLVTYCREVGAEAIHTTTDYTNAIIASEAAKTLQIPWVYEVRGELESTWASTRGIKATSSEFYRIAHEAETRAMQSASHVVVLSEIYRQNAIARGVSSEKITVIPNAIERSFLENKPSTETIEAKKQELGLDENDIVITAITSVVAYEGLETLIDAIKFLPENFVAIIVGDGADLPRLQTMAATLRRRVLFVGKQPQKDINIWYALSDVFVIPRFDLPVTRNVTPIKGLQAQAYGVPLVVSDLPALREVTGGIATYVEPADPNSLAAAIKTVAGEYSEDAVQWAMSRTWERNGNTYRRIYRG